MTLPVPPSPRGAAIVIWYHSRRSYRLQDADIADVMVPASIMQPDILISISPKSYM